MFFTKKWLFFAIVYAMSVGFYYFADKWLSLVEIHLKFFTHSFLIYGFIILSSAVLSFLIMLLLKFIYFLYCKIFRAEENFAALKTFWMIWTIFAYLEIFAAFFYLIR